MSRPKIARRQWEEKYAAAKKFMESRERIGSVLIEVAAQHPLTSGRYPNKEFEERLLLGEELYRRYRRENREVEIYVPGSRHVFGGVEDEISLARAGTEFLLKRGLPKKSVHGEDLNELYKGESGVYNSADECFVAASYFKDVDFGHLVSVVSPAQLMRKSLYYIWFGVIPSLHTAPTKRPFHSYVDEAYRISDVINNDPDMKGKESRMARKLRRDRKPK